MVAADKVNYRRVAGAPPTQPTAPCGGGVGGVPLGTTTKFAAIPSETANSGPDFEGASRRVLRYVYQSAARELLGSRHRVGLCLRSIKRGAAGVEVYHAAAHGSAHYGGVMVCGLHWVCPVCAAKIASRRVLEVEQAVELVQRHEGVVLFMTLTVPHYSGQAPGPLVRDFLAAVRSFKSLRAYKALMAERWHLGEIRSLEVTHGGNGWHPHTHSLHFFPERLGWLTPLRDELAGLWASVVARRGLGASHAVHGLDLRAVGASAGEDARAVADYVVKLDEGKGWGPADELVRGNSKQARRGGRSPFALLADYAMLEDGEAGELFKAYARAFKGKNHLRWSRGLREHLGLSWAPRTDQQLAEEQTEEADLLGVLTREQWRVVLCAGRSARGELLEVASGGDWGQVVAFVRSLSRGGEHG